MSRSYHVAILGATGAVGQEFLRLFESRNFPTRELSLLASERSAGKRMLFRGEELCVEAVNKSSFKGVDLAFFSAGASRSKEYASFVNAGGAIVIDNSSAFRMNSEVPLVIPEINFDSIPVGCRLIANPNCSAIIMLMAVAPLRELGELSRLVISTYQSASGAGAAAMEELQEQTRGVLAGQAAQPKIMPHPYAFNLFSHNTPINEHGYNDEEWKVIQESRKILGMPELRINVTCIRVPVLRAHSESVTIEFKGEAPSEEEVREVLASAPGVKLVDDRESNTFPMPLIAEGKEEVLVGRIRKDLSHPSAISLFVAGDQLLKGAALNAVQIAERMLPQA